MDDVSENVLIYTVLHTHFFKTAGAGRENVIGHLDRSRVPVQEFTQVMLSCQDIHTCGKNDKSLVSK